MDGAAETKAVPARVRAAVRERDGSTCSIEGCLKPVCRGTRGWCRMHLGRWERHGDPNVMTWARRRVTSHGYVRLSGFLGHPLADERGEVYEHRKVLFEFLGPGTHPCIWCSEPVAWEDGSLAVDHLDWNKQNNAVANLLPSCVPCNVRRRSPGLIGVFEEGVCVHCGRIFIGRHTRTVCSPACSKRAYRLRLAVRARDVTGSEVAAR